MVNTANNYHNMFWTLLAVSETIFERNELLCQFFIESGSELDEKGAQTVN